MANEKAPKSKAKPVFYLIYGLFLFLFVELVLRICFPLPELSNFNRMTYQVLDRSAGEGGYIRNIHMQWKSVLDTNTTFVHALNRYGYRDPKEWEVEKPKGKKRILFVGDSFVEGMMSTADATIPVGFEKAAGAEADGIEWMNAGMMGIGLNDYMKFIADAVPIFRPDELFLVLYSNDAPFQRQYQPNRVLNPKRFSVWTPRLLTIWQQIQANDPIPFAFSPEKRPFYKAVPDEGNPWTFHEAEMKKHVTPVIAEAMKKGDFNFFRSNWVLEEEKFLKSPVELRSKLQFIRDYLNQYQCKLQVFYIPSRNQVSQYYYQFEKQCCLQNCPETLDLTTETYQIHARTLKSDCQALNIPFVDFTNLIAAEEQKGNHLYWNYDDHMRGKGYLMIGKAIYQNWMGKGS